MLKEYFSISEILKLKLEGYSNDGRLFKQASEEHWIYQTVKLEHSDKPVKEYHISNFPKEVREKIVNRLLEKQRLEQQVANLSGVEKIEREAYARFEIVHYVTNNKVSKEQFIKDYNKKRTPLGTYDVIENITHRTLYRWIKDYQKQGFDGLKSKGLCQKVWKG